MMARTKQVSKRKRRRVGLPALGAAGVSLVMAGGAAANAPTANVPSLQDTSLRPAITLDEEEIADVSLGTFYVFDKENDSQLGQGIRLAAHGGCGRCGGGCAAARCGGCAGRCAVARCGGAARCAVARCAVARCAVGVDAQLAAVAAVVAGGESPGRRRRRGLRRIRRRLLAVDARWLGLGLLLRE